MNYTSYPSISHKSLDTTLAVVVLFKSPTNVTWAHRSHAAQDPLPRREHFSWRNTTDRASRHLTFLWHFRSALSIFFCTYTYLWTVWWLYTKPWIFFFFFPTMGNREAHNLLQGTGSKIQDLRISRLLDRRFLRSWNIFSCWNRCVEGNKERVIARLLQQRAPCNN